MSQFALHRPFTADEPASILENSLYFSLLMGFLLENSSLTTASSAIFIPCVCLCERLPLVASHLTKSANGVKLTATRRPGVPFPS